MNNTFGLPDELFQSLVSTDARHGFPPGTMASILQQEVGGSLDKYLSNPATYHYAAGADGLRRGAQGQVSSAFGPFGFLDSTAQDPGWGVQPLQDKNDLNEHIRFAGDYLAARIRQTGDFSKGIGAYGEGDQYAEKVLSRIPAFQSQDTAPQFAQAAKPPVTPADGTPEVPGSVDATQVAANPVPPEWEQFRSWVPRRDEPTGSSNPLQQLARVGRPDFSQSLEMANAMMQRNQGTLMNGWEALRGWQ